MNVTPIAEALEQDHQAILLARAAVHVLGQAVARARQEEIHGRADGLARRAQAGDLGARAALYEEMAPLIAGVTAPALRWARTLPGSRLDLEDVRQQVFVLFCAVLRDWQPTRAPFAVYLGSVLNLRLRRFVRGAARPREVALPADYEEGDPLPGTAPALEPNPGDGYPGRTRAAAWLATLAPAVRAVVVLHALDGLPLDEVAARLGLGQRAVYRRWATGRAMLRRLAEAEAFL